MSWEEWYQLAKQWLIDNYGLNSAFAYQMAKLCGWAMYYGLDFTLTSGFRDPARQRELQRKWDAGNRAGLVSRPATNSKHCHTYLGRPDALALDISSAHLPTLGGWAEKYLGLKWGGNFRNPSKVHFQTK